MLKANFEKEKQALCQVLFINMTPLSILQPIFDKLPNPEKMFICITLNSDSNKWVP